MLFSRVVPSFLLACPHRRSLPASRGVLAIVCGLVLRRPRCLLRSVVVGSSWADRRLVSSSSWFLLVVGRRCSSSSCLLALGCRCRPCWPCGSFRRLVSSARSLAPSCLSSGGEACVPSSLAARCSGRAPLFRSFPAACRLVPYPSSFLAFPSRYHAGSLRLSAARVWACCLLVLSQSVRWRGRLVPACCLPTIRISPRLSCRGAGRYFFSCRLFRLFR